MLRSVDLKDYMLTKPVIISAQAHLFEAIDLIVKNRVSGLCVVDHNGNFLGILSELDCMKGILCATYHQDSPGEVAKYMVTENINCARPGDDIVDIAQDMLSKGQRRRPVIDENGKLVGQITCRRILAAVKSFNSTAAHA